MRKFDLGCERGWFCSSASLPLDNVGRIMCRGPIHTTDPTRDAQERVGGLACICALQGHVLAILWSNFLPQQLYRWIYGIVQFLPLVSVHYVSLTWNLAGVGLHHPDKGGPILYYLLVPCDESRGERAVVSPPWTSKECETSAQELLMLQSGLLRLVHVFLSSRCCQPNPQVTAFPPECT